MMRMAKVAVVGAMGMLVAAPFSPLESQSPSSSGVRAVVADGEVEELSNTRARLNVEDVPLVDALEALEEASGIAMAYSPTMLPPEVTVTCACEENSVGEAIGVLLQDTGLEAIWVTGRLIIREARLDRASETAPPPQVGVISGRVTSSDGEPLSSATVRLEDTGYRTVTDDEGRYTLSDVDPGSYRVIAEMLGYADERRSNVQVVAGETTNVDFSLAAEALRLEGVVTAGMADPVEGIRAPFSVARVGPEDVPMAPRDVREALHGRVAGARVVRPSGEPGSGVAMRLRSRLGVNTSDSPLLVVDGVVQTGSLADIDPQDIESMEVLRGAAGASLYGSRAQAGVIEITTRRGTEATPGDTRFSVSTEYGQSFVGSVDGTATHHPYRVNEGGLWVDEDGDPVRREDRVLRDDRMHLSPYGGELRNHVEEFVDPGQFHNTRLSIARNAEDTNFFVSFGNNREGGIVPEFNEGYERNNARLNVDHHPRNDLTMSFTGYYSRSSTEELYGSNPFQHLRFIAPDVDLREPNDPPNEDQPFHIRPDPTMISENPLYPIWAREAWWDRGRTQGSLQSRYTPRSWLNIDALMAYDRSERTGDRFTPDGYISLQPQPENDGQVIREHRWDRAWNAHLQGSVNRTFGDLSVRTQLRWSYEHEERERFTSRGTNFRVEGVPTIDNTQDRYATHGNIRDVRNEALQLTTGLNYQDKYIADLVLRRDGSSLFGPDNRWHTYYRGSLAYLMSEEDWWRWEWVTAFKPRYSIGTAGSQPGYSWRFETWDVGVDGPRKSTLGNRDLAPEVTTEQEFGLDVILLDRYSAELTYVRTTVDEQLVPVSLPGYYGFSQQWQNAGQVKARAYEASLEADLLRGSRVSWRMGAVADRTSSWLSEWGRTCYTTQRLFRRCEGESFSTMRGIEWMTSHGDLPDEHAGSADQFQVNDDGYLVPVGDHDWQDGLAEGLWGTRVEIDGVEYDWGHPIGIRDEEGMVDDLRAIGDAEPTLELGWTNDLRWRGFRLWSVVSFKWGGDVYNTTRQRPYRDNLSPDMVQVGKSEDEQKPLDYYQELYASNARNSHFIEDGSYMKLREVSLDYQISNDQLERLFSPLAATGLDEIRLSVTGRNLLTVSSYSGLDPEVGLAGAGGPTENPRDSFPYPNFRTFTFGVEANF